MIAYTINVFETGQAVATAFIDGKPYTVSNAQPVYDRIVQKLHAGDTSVVSDFDLANFANKAFHEVTDRVNIRQGVLYLDDNPVNNAVAKLVLDYLGEGNDAMPLVNFLTRLDANPSYNSREQLWRFIENNNIHVDDDGYIILYKGVHKTDEADVYQSSSSGRAFVNGVEQNGRIRTRKGDVVTMPRREISDDPGVACHAGLHCGAHSYAVGFAPVLVTVRVDPAHVVSVPTDSADRKVRVERYEIMDVREDKSEAQGIRWSDSRTHDEDFDVYDEDDYYDDDDF